MKKNMFILLALCMVIISCKKDDDTLEKSKEPYVYTVKEMGTLGTMLNSTQKDTITKMIVKGEINAADFEVMNKEMPLLQHIDLLGVKCDNYKIPDEAFYKNKTINTFVFPKDITRIGKSAFADCTSLTGSLTLPNSVLMIESFAFYNCTGFDGMLTLSENLEALGQSAFYNCSGFTGSLTLPEHLEIIEAAAFLNCSGFNGALNLPDKLTEIQNEAFRNCSDFTGSLRIPERVTRIATGVFMDCSGFNKLEILGSNLTRIENSAFRHCVNISGELIIPLSIEIIREYAFDGCSIKSFQFSHTKPLYYFHDMLISEAIVKVPMEAVDVYEATEGWENHTIVGF